MLSPVPYRSQWPVLPYKAMLASLSKQLQPRAMYGSLALLQQESVLMSVSPVTIKSMWMYGVWTSPGAGVMVKSGTHSVSEPIKI